MHNFTAPFPVSPNPEEDITGDSTSDNQQAKAEVTKNSAPCIPSPLTSKIPPAGGFFLEVIKNGTTVDRINIDSPRIVFGRATDASVVLDHPSISRYHAALLWNPEEGVNSFILRDLKSTHGTVVNRERMPSASSIKISANNGLLSFGGSSRFYILTSTLPDEPVSEGGCEWGQEKLESVNSEEPVDDEPEAEFELIQSFLSGEEITSSPNEDAFLEDPHKFLVKWFEQEGYPLQSETMNKDGFFVTTIQLPIEGRDFEVPSTPQAKKKDALVNACLFACRLLDKAKRLFPWQKSAEPSTKRNLEEDAEEGVLDETVSIKKPKATNFVHTFDSLTADWNKLSCQVIDLKAKLAAMTSAKAMNQTQSTDGDSLDDFMGHLSDERETTESKILKSKLRLQIKQLEKEQERISKLIVAAKPNARMPTLTSSTENTSIPLVQDVSVRPSEATSVASNVSSTPKLTSTAAVAEECPRQEEKLSNESDSPASQVKFVIKAKTPSTKPLPKLDNAKTPVQSLSSTAVNSIGESLSRLKESKKPVKINTNTSEDFVDWLPPENQDGTGRLSLNDKLGY